MKKLMGFLSIFLSLIVSKAQTTRIGLQFDNVVYSEGDTVHFQGFVLENGLPAENTKTLFVDWFGVDNQLLSHQAYPIVDGSAAGQWTIPNIYDGAAFKVLAYTNAMIQKENLYHKEIPILGRSSSTPFNIQLYPEGGHLIDGVSNRIGYFIEGQSADTPLLVSSSGDTLMTVPSLMNEYGSFVFTPENGKNYMLLAGKKIFPLPLALAGIAIETTSYPNVVVAMLRKTKEYTLDSLWLKGEINGETVYESRINVKDSGFVEIKTKGLPSGAMRLHLMDRAGQLLASRSVYIQGQPSFDSITLSRNSNEKGKNELWQLLHQDSLPTRVAISIRDAVFEDKDGNIKGWLLLGRDIPDSLLYKKDVASLIAIDNRMRYTGLETNNQFHFRDTSYFGLSGKVQGKKLPKEVSLIFRSNGIYQPLKLSLDVDGRFRDSSLILFDSCYVALAGGQDGLTLEVDTLAPAPYKKYPFAFQKELTLMVKKKKKTKDENPIVPQYVLPKELLAYGDTTGGHHLLPNVSVQSKKWRNKMDSVEAFYATEYFKELNGYRFDLTNDMTLYMTTLWGYFEGRLPGFINDEAHIPKNIFIDEVYSTKEAVDAIPASQVAFVKYIRGPRFGQQLYPGPSVLVYTKKYTDPTLKERMAKNWGKSIIGYTSYVPFGQSYAPKNKDRSDNRKTLYWQPSIVLDKDNPELPINFTNNGIAKKLLLVVDGIRIDGTPFHYEEVVMSSL